MIPLILIIGIMYSTVNYAVNAPDTPQEIAARAKCDPADIAYWVNYKIEYMITPKWESAQDCLDRGTGDCKCKAVIAHEAVVSCGYDAETVSLRDNDRRHAVLFFKDHNGKYGFIDGRRGELTTAKDWKEITDYVPGGPWTRYQ